MKKADNLVKVSVTQLYNKNQFLITYLNEQNQHILVFQSYRTVIAIYNAVTKELYLNYHYWDYSKTTSKHLKIFVNEYTPYNYNNKKDFTGVIINNKNIDFFE